MARNYCPDVIEAFEAFGCCSGKFSFVSTCRWWFLFPLLARRFSWRWTSIFLCIGSVSVGEMSTSLWFTLSKLNLHRGQHGAFIPAGCYFVPCGDKNLPCLQPALPQSHLVCLCSVSGWHFTSPGLILLCWCLAPGDKSQPARHTPRPMQASGVGVHCSAPGRAVGSNIGASWWTSRGTCSGGRFRLVNGEQRGP